MTFRANRFLLFGLFAMAVLVYTSVRSPNVARGAGQDALQSRMQAGAGADDATTQAGQQLFQTNCSFCHGIDARGGAQGGVDLVTSQIVRQDTDGKQLGEFIHVGRPDRGMPKFDLGDDDVSKIAAFLHARVAVVAAANAFGRGGDPKVILVGDAKAGEAYFNGVGGCTACHSVTGDLKGIGGKYDPRTLQNSMVLPRGRGGAFFPQANKEVSIRVTVAPKSGPVVSGALVAISDFDLTLTDSTGNRRTFARDGDVPKVTIEDPLQGHIALLSKISDKEIHDLTAYLVTLK